MLSIQLLGIAQPDKFATANQLYEEQKFEEALALYEEIQHTGNESVALFYNLGNTYYQTNNIGQSVLYFERALRMSPGNSEIIQNLNLVNQSVQPELSQIPSFFLLSSWNVIVKTLNSTTWAILSIIFWVLFALCTGLWLLHRNIAIRKKSFYSGICMFLFGALMLIFACGKYYIETSTNEAIIIVKETSLMSGPVSRSKETLRLGEGTKVMILDQIEQWLKVELSDRETGWLPKEAIAII